MFFCENHRNSYKRKYEKISFDQKTCFYQKTKLLLCLLTKIFLKEKSAEPDQVKLALL